MSSSWTALLLVGHARFFFQSFELEENQAPVLGRGNGMG